MTDVYGQLKPRVDLSMLEANKNTKAMKDQVIMIVLKITIETI